MRVLALVLSFCIFGIYAWAEPHFEKRKIKVGHQSLIVEIADSDELRAHGLMYRKKLELNHGMLFVFEDAEYRSFWMKNTYIPLAIGFFDQDQKLIEIIEMKPGISGALNPKAYPSKAKAKYALEVSTGWFQKMKIRPGAQFTFADNKEHK